jgi:hypothetical protein
MSAKVSIADIEKAMGQRADVSPYKFDQESMSWGRTITFHLKPKRRKAAKRARTHKGKNDG